MMDSFLIIKHMNTSKNIAGRQIRSKNGGFVYSVIGALALATLVGCNKSEEPASSSKQVVAKVNGKEITVHQLKNEFAAQSAMGAASKPTMTRATLDSLIDEQLLVELGKERKLNRDPQVIQAEEKAYRQIMIRTLQDSLIASQPQPNNAEIRAFYDQNPGLFSNRRIYTFRQFTVDRTAINDMVKTKLDQSKSREDVSNAFKNANIKYRELVSVRAAEQLPMAALPAMAKMSAGDVAIVNENNDANVIQLMESVEQPATLEQATPIIREYLISAKKRQLTADLLKSLRSTAKVEYVGDIVIAEQNGSASQPSATSPANPQKSEPAKDGTKEDAIRKGLQADKI
jgi:EpsD family peptidyl-prolyl cis-trans isomerase